MLQIDRMQARETMTRRVLIAPPELSLAQAWSIMERHRIRHLPVAAGGTLLGIASDRDLLLLARPTKEGTLEFDARHIAEAMTPSPITCEPTTPVAELVRVMTERKIDAVPVLDAVDRLVGLVTSTDLMLLLLEQEEARAPIPFRFELVETSALAA
ncbi:MAG: CBS domain-containing protein [Myxococcales bacterium]|nr:CBS domain-containing protein [Myxococcales bacterium]